ncbi:MAG: flagellar export protein FliJ [Clostridiales bacterium]|nr:flagellar export protein FliJ [Clostridiales bacterium]
MKKFNFRFQKILLLRIDKENEIRNNLGKINKVILEKENEFEMTRKKYEEFLNSLNDSVQEGIYVRDMQAVSNNKQYLIQKMDRLKHELTALVEQRIEIQKELIEANKQRKIMEKLKEKEIEQYQAMETLEESKTVDQIVTYQSSKTRGEN